jgi:hypothetical protein
VFECYCVPVLTYGAETWTWIRVDTGRQMAVEARFVRCRR